MPLHHCSRQVLKKRFFLLDWRKMCLYSLWPIKLNSKVMLLVCCCCFGEALNWSFQRLVESAALALLSGVNYFLWKKRALTRELQVEELIPDGSELNVCPVCWERKKLSIDFFALIISCWIKKPFLFIKAAIDKNGVFINLKKNYKRKGSGILGCEFGYSSCIFGLILNIFRQ